MVFFIAHFVAYVNDGLSFEVRIDKWKLIPGDVAKICARLPAKSGGEAVKKLTLPLNALYNKINEEIFGK